MIHLLIILALIPFALAGLAIAATIFIRIVLPLMLFLGAIVAAGWAICALCTL